MKFLLFLITLILPLTTIQAEIAPQPSATELAQSDLDARMEWFTQDRFGMFIHWGVYSTLGGEWKGKRVPGYAEWIQARANIPSKEYAQLSKNFNPTDYDPEKWVLAAKKAGMKYIVITTKHHDGFCLWPSDVTTYDIDDASPFKRDILTELSAACKKHGIKFGTYYSLIDWHHPSQEPNPKGKGHFGRWGNNLMKEGRKQEYVTYMKAQIKELIEKYDTEIMWFDGDWNPWWTRADGEDLYCYIRELKPSIIINNRVSKRGQFKYDYGTPENVTPGAALAYYWEACWTMNHTWGYSKYDKKWKSDRVLIQKLVDIASKGGNLLLNVGPKADGTIQDEAYQGLEALGKWMKVNSESIYSTRFSPITAPVKTRLTAKGDNQLYLHLFAPTQQQSVSISLTTDKASALGLAGGSQIPVTVDKKSITLDLSKITWDDNVTTIRIDLPNGYKTLKKELVALKDGDVLLNATDAKILGNGPLKIEAANHALGHWNNVDQSAQWKREVVVSGSFELILVYALDKAYHGGEVTVTMSSGKELSQTLKATKGWTVFQQVSLGKISLTAMKPETITVSGKNSAEGTKALMNLRGIILRPVQ